MNCATILNHLQYPVLFKSSARDLVLQIAKLGHTACIGMEIGQCLCAMYVFLAQCAAVFLCESTHDGPSVTAQLVLNVSLVGDLIYEMTCCLRVSLMFPVCT